MTEQQKARIVELARQTEGGLRWAENFDAADLIRFNARYTARYNSAEAFRIAKGA